MFNTFKIFFILPINNRFFNLATNVTSVLRECAINFAELTPDFYARLGKIGATGRSGIRCDPCGAAKPHLANLEDVDCGAPQGLCLPPLHFLA